MSLAQATPIAKDGPTSDANTSVEHQLGDSTPRASDFQQPVDTQAEDKKDGKVKKRSLFGFGKKKPASPSKSESTLSTDHQKSEGLNQSQPQTQLASSSKTTSATTSPPTLSRDSSKLSTRAPTNEQASGLPTSPSHGFTDSPRLSSPATSQIFERDVQDSTVLKPSSPAIPTHIQTENYIPSVLDDASEAITNEKLDPDNVEIVTHSSHQPASVTVTGASNGLSSYDQTSSEWAAELASFADREAMSPDNASNYGSLDSSDVRRLSFISFADVVQAEHAPSAGVASSRDSIHMAGLTSLPPAAINRSPSPIRSPVSSQGPETSPPTSNPASIKGFELSPRRRPLGSPTSNTNLKLNPGSDLNIETMSQALRRTGSTDLSNVRSIPTSPTEPSGLR